MPRCQRSSLCRDNATRAAAGCDRQPKPWRATDSVVGTAGGDCGVDHRAPGYTPRNDRKDSHGRPRARRQRRERRDLHLHRMRYSLDVQSTKHLPPCPQCSNGLWATVTGGDSASDPYPNR
jgi:hypothetical protein